MASHLLRDLYQEKYIVESNVVKLATNHARRVAILGRESHSET
jgi:hypothetical protein